MVARVVWPEFPAFRLYTHRFMSTDDEDMNEHATPVPAVRRLLAVCAHPYDATFALGGVLAAFAGAGTKVRVVCLTHGRRSDPVPRRRLERARDLGRAGRHLGVEDIVLLDHAPGSLATTRIDQLADEIVSAGHDADALLTVDAVGSDAHPDHVRTMRAAYRAATRLGSTLYARTLRPPTPEHTQRVLLAATDRERQQAAIACHTGLPADDPLRSRWLHHQQGEEQLIVLRAERVRGQIAART